MKEAVFGALGGTFCLGVLGGWAAAFLQYRKNINHEATMLFDEWMADRLEAESRRRHPAARASRDS